MTVTTQPISKNLSLSLTTLIFEAVTANDTVHGSWLRAYGQVVTPIIDGRGENAGYVIYWENRQITIHRRTEAFDVFTVMRAGTSEIAPNRKQALDIYIEHYGDQP